MKGHLSQILALYLVCVGSLLKLPMADCLDKFILELRTRGGTKMGYSSGEITQMK
jgi:hypothetical protein